jgi:hypothetical protein
MLSPFLPTRNAKSPFFGGQILCGIRGKAASDSEGKKATQSEGYRGAGARQSAQLNASLAKPIVVYNRGGAGGILGMDEVAKLAPDGYAPKADVRRMEWASSR